MTQLATNFNPTVDYLPPAVVEAEESVLGGCLVDPSAYSRVKDIITSTEAFYFSTHKQIWKAIEALARNGKNPDMMTVTAWLGDKGILHEIGSTHTIAQLVERNVSIVNIDRHARLIMSKYRLRQLIETGNILVEQGYKPGVSEENIAEVLKFCEKKVYEVTHCPEAENALDAQRWQYENIVKRVKNILLKVEEAGYREFLLKDLGDKFKMTVSQLKVLYHKSILGNNNGKSFTIKELREKHGNDITEWLIHGWLPRGSSTMIHAPGGVGKSLLSYDFVFHLAIGEDWNDFAILGKTKGLFIQTDESESDLLSHLTARGFTNEMDIHFKTNWAIDYIPQLYNEIKEQGYHWVVIDSLTSISRNSCVSENDVEYAMPVLQLNQIASELGCHILILHHSSKMDGSARGTSAIQAAVSQVIRLDYDKDSRDDCMRIATFSKSRSRSPGAYRIRLNADLDRGKRNFWTVEEEVDSAFADELNKGCKGKIKALLKENPNIPFLYRDICDALPDENNNTIRRCLGKMAGTGEIVRKERPGKLANLYFLGNIQPWLDRTKSNGPSQGDTRASMSNVKNSNEPSMVYKTSETEGGNDRDREGDRMVIIKSDHIQSHDAPTFDPDRDHLITKNGKFSEETGENFPKKNDRAIVNEVKGNDGAVSGCDRINDRIGDRDRKNDRQQIDITDIADLLQDCDNYEAYEVVKDIVQSDFLMEEAIALLGTELQAKIKGFLSVTTELTDGDRELIDKIEACRSFKMWEQLEKVYGREAIDRVFTRVSPIRRLEIEKMIRQEREEEEKIEREVIHDNPFSRGDRVVCPSSPLYGAGEVLEIHKNQCRVRWQESESVHYSAKLLKTGQAVYYKGSDPQLQETFRNPNSKRHSLPLTVKTIGQGKNPEIEVSREDWVMSFWVFLSELNSTP